MILEEKIYETINSIKSMKNAELSEIRTTEGTNKEEKHLLYVQASFIEKPVGSENYGNNCIYFVFDEEGNYLGCVKTNIINQNPPTEIEMEYWAAKDHKNKGNMTLMAKEVLKQIFEDKIYDNLKVRKNFSTSKIDTVMLAIREDNEASMAVARKLGFTKVGSCHLLHIDDYFKQKEDSKNHSSNL